MSDQDVNTSKYSKLRSMYKYYIDSFALLYQLKTTNEDELNVIYKMIKMDLIESKKHLPQNIIKDILNIIQYNNISTKSYLILAKLIADNYHVTEVRDISPLSNFLFYKEYGIKLDIYNDFEDMDLVNLDLHSESSLYRAILHDDKDFFIFCTESEGFDENQELTNGLYPHYYKRFSFLELCCYHGAVDCFKILRTKFEAEITQECLEFSFLGRNKEIMSECLKYQKPNEECMINAIISHNIDFVTFLWNEYNMEINLYACGEFNNIEAFLVYFDQTNDINKCFFYSPMFDISSLCEYFLSLGADVNTKNENGEIVFHYTSLRNCKEIIELLLSHGADINSMDERGATALHYAVLDNNKESIQLLLSCGANINQKDEDGESVLHQAVFDDNKEITEFLVSLGANINQKNNDGKTALHFAAENDNKEIAEILLLHGANINAKDIYGNTALHIAVENNSKETAKILLLHGADINEKNDNGQTALHIAVDNNTKKITEILLLHGANINEKDKMEKTPLQIATENDRKKIVKLLLLHSANIN
ncbi:ankyrin repeat protein, putative [Trichomonas vaginalis G3]|uniref:Ankyrin repeat protein, putative n=1 Tax=Trichomonas vaginalis (strain ATCC PRA-98 / G3) TaxID=412133 RepID=A2DL82_TRIV3|nr:ankyrin repeat and SOCS box-containing protein 4 family [Trichomonas vaginalis G3]EAY18873.1 ankyrin repeat protein, putative [Trichomonas vaginalis G3]KAI5526008.1 ankyrin repeat and SOCS box-containing protein 4 family [Trichomonas vaginalis G3]|eukprot:XP_001579859.1 ankyrin repeat protein [Trichomonas vaginalis G3]